MVFSAHFPWGSYGNFRENFKFLALGGSTGFGINYPGSDPGPYGSLRFSSISKHLQSHFFFDEGKSLVSSDFGQSDVFFGYKNGALTHSSWSIFSKIEIVETRFSDRPNTEPSSVRIYRLFHSSCHIGKRSTSWLATSGPARLLELFDFLLIQVLARQIQLGRVAKTA